MWFLAKIDMNNNIWKKRFFRFLKEEDVYALWINNVYNQHPIDDKGFWTRTFQMILFSERNRCRYSVLQAFSWAKTSQGAHFWHSIDQKWLALLGKDK